MPASLLCPLCRQPLVRDGGSYLCPARHTFDRAKQGYTNLLVGHAAGQHGDNAEMILARRTFLDGGFYAPLRAAVAAAAQRHAKPGMTLLDAGCGECYYTDAVMGALAPVHPVGYGVDISREALRAAGRRQSVRDGSLSLFAAGVYDLPFADNSMDMIFNLFAPLATAEYKRLLPEGGVLIMAFPAARHLWEMKTVLYDTPRENEVADFALPGFTLLSAEEVIAPFTLPTQELIAALFSMTPYCYRTPAEGRARLSALSELSVTADFHLLTYRRDGTVSAL